MRIYSKRTRALELELIKTQMTQKPMLRAEVYARALRASQNRNEKIVLRAGSIQLPPPSKATDLLTNKGDGRCCVIEEFSLMEEVRRTYRINGI